MSDNKLTGLSRKIIADTSIPFPQKVRIRQAETLERCSALQARAGCELVFGGLTALHAAGIDVPQGIDSDELVVVSTPTTARHRHHGTVPTCWGFPMPTTLIDGVRIVKPEIAWIMLARTEGLGHVTMLGDALLRRDRDMKYTTADRLRQSVSAFVQEVQGSERAGAGTTIASATGSSGTNADADADDANNTAATRKKPRRKLPRGFDTCLRALDLVRDNTDSFAETRLRLLLMQCGLPCPQVNPRIEVPTGGAVDDASAGGYYSGRPTSCFYLDLAYGEHKLAIEYDGKQHEQRWESDIRRFNLLNNAGWTRLGATHDDLSLPVKQMEFVHGVAQRLEQLSGRKIDVHKPVSLRQLTIHLRRWGDA